MTRLIVYNSEYGEGLLGHVLEYLKFWRYVFPPKEQNKQITEALKKYKPDILGIAEIDLGSIRYNHKNQAAFFSKELSLKHIAAHSKYAKKSILLNTIPILKKQGNAVFSKYPFDSVSYNEFTNSMKRSIIHCTIKINKKKLNLLLIHLPLNYKARQKQFVQLMEMINQIKGPIILMGDFNTFRGKDEIKELLETTDLNYQYNRGKHQQKHTQPAFKPKRTLDYVLTSKEISVTNYKILPIELSDHLPVMIDFSIK